ncbi:protein spire homolog 1-like isoform X3 [Scyliorhinus torazame]|uniref:protein spire homolog 1-like isoform X3 n=1 Tax=Scyliorhinus torazame TaxID=75743 RepID=UPI003B5AAED6
MAEQSPAAAAEPDCQELSLEQILKLYNQPLNEEQAWAVCYQCCSSLHRQRRPPPPAQPAGDRQPCWGRLSGARAVILHRDGNISIRGDPDKGETRRCTEPEVIESVGILVYKALDWGLKDNEERELSPPLEHLIGRMTNILDDVLATEVNLDEGYDGQDEEEEQKEIVTIRYFKHVMMLCAAHLTTSSEAPNHYQAVCRALFAESMELRTFLAKIKSAKENLKKLLDNKGESSQSNMELSELNNFDWACFWVQVMRDLRNGVKLKKVQERQYNPLPIEYQLTPYEMLMDDIRSRRYTLRKVMVNGNMPPKLKKSAHEIILDFIRSRPPLNPASARKLKPHPARPRSLHERILEEIKSERKLRPVSPDEIRRSKYVMRPLSMSCSFDLSDVTTPERSRKISPLRLANGAVMSQTAENDAHSLQVQRRKLLKAPTLAEMDSSDSEEERIKMLRSSSSASTFKVEDSSPETPNGKKTPPMFLPISSTPQPERRKQPQRRHSIEKETPTNVRQFLPPSRQSSKSLEEFCYPVECLALTVEEVMHIRQVLVKAELEKYQQYKDVYTALKKGKLCFCCRTKRFSIFTWSYTCQFCKRPVCSQCCKKMRLPSKPYSNLPIFSLGPSTLPKEGKVLKPEKPSSSRRRHDGQHKSLVRLPSMSKSSEKSTDSLEFPKELMEDWSTMEVCVDCKKFISEIISSSRRSLVLANKRARLKRKTQSFYLSSTSTSEFRLAAPKERTIKEEGLDPIDIGSGHRIPLAAVEN